MVDILILSIVNSRNSQRQQARLLLKFSFISNMNPSRETQVDMNITVRDLTGESVAPVISLQPPRHQAPDRTPVKRSRTPADKEHKRLKRVEFMPIELYLEDVHDCQLVLGFVEVFYRLLRNRVAAQQARERRKAYIHDLESKSEQLERKNKELEERVSILQKENQVLRQIVKNTTMNETDRSGMSEGEKFVE